VRNDLGISSYFRKVIILENKCVSRKNRTKRSPEEGKRPEGAPPCLGAPYGVFPPSQVRFASVSTPALRLTLKPSIYTPLCRSNLAPKVFRANLVFCLFLSDLSPPKSLHHRRGCLHQVQRSTAVLLQWEALSLEAQGVGRLL